MPVAKHKDAHIWDRDPHDWYVEPPECSLAFLDHNQYAANELIWDPACGLGRIVQSAKLLGLNAIGSDLVSRSEDCEFVADFLSSDNRYSAKHIVSNPPFGIAEQFVQRALEIVPEGGTVAMLLPLVWASGFSTKREWLPRSPLASMQVMSPRPSMPPGRVILAGEKPGNGTKDFAWFQWKKGRVATPELHFLNTSPYRHFLRNNCQGTLWPKHQAAE